MTAHRLQLIQSAQLTSIVILTTLTPLIKGKAIFIYLHWNFHNVKPHRVNLRRQFVTEFSKLG